MTDAIHNAIRPGGGPTSPGGLHLAARVPALVSRLRGPELDHLGSLISSDSPSQLTEMAQSFSHQRDSEIRRREHFQEQIRNIETPTETQQILRQFLSENSGPRLKKDTKALRRWLNADALVERMDARIDQMGVYLELITRLMGGLNLNGPAVQMLEGLLNDSRLATRREAARTLAEWCVTQQATGEMDTKLAERILKTGLDPNQDPLTARSCLLVLCASDGSGERILKDGLQNFSSSPLLRTQLVKVGLLGGSTRRDIAWENARLDPSEQVRCSLAHALAAEASTVSLDRLRSLSHTDAAHSVRTQAQLHLQAHDSTPIDDPFEPGPEMQALVTELRSLRCGEATTILLPEGESPIDLAVSLLGPAEKGFGFALAPAPDGRVRVSRGDQKVLRFWRIFHELRHPHPGKRRLGDHLSGRAKQGPIRVTSGCLAEQIPTGVPNQTAHSPGVPDAAPWLPTPERFLEAADWGSVLVISQEGVTTLLAPEGTLSRLWAQLRISTQMTRLDGQRKNSLSAKDPDTRKQYVADLQRLGFNAHFEPHPECQAPLPSIHQHFGILTPALLAANNSTTDLGLVAAAMGFYTLNRLSQNRRQTIASRKSIPLAIGNWGTRGKSSVARLQAALFEGLGYPVFCKTTGSEASILFAGPGRPSQRLMSYRPLDKVSIFEHAESLKLASSLGARVFIWECMALRPEYVDQVQHEWTQDDLSIITNAHADHEDRQGPTGRDVAEVIARFIPKDALTLSAEKEMRPILQEAADEKGCIIDWVEPQTIHAIPGDVLGALPYQAHPANVALVLEMAKALGCDRDEAAFLIAQHAKADLGALRTTPSLRHLGRSLKFTNGMSANQPTGLMNNWRRCGFFDVDPAGRPDQFVLSLVNNRQDRPNRSAAFARSIVRDLPAHRHILMGTNIEGLARQIEDELGIALGEWTLPKGPRSMERRLKLLRRQLCLTSPGPLLRSTAKRLGLRGTQVTSVAADLDNYIAQAPERLLSLSAARKELAPLRDDFLALAQQMEGSLFHSSKERRQVIDDAVDNWLDCAAEALAFSAMARACNLTSDTRERLDLARKCYRELFLAHIVLVPGNPTPDHLFNVVARSAPPGTQIRCMAIQNIKGPGLGLARCLSAAHERLKIRESLTSSQLEIQRQGLSSIVQTGGWSTPLCQELLRSIYAMPVEVHLRAERDRAVKHLHHALAECEDNLRLESNMGGISRRWKRTVSGFMNPLMALPRRWRADQILKDLSQNQISNARAAQELERIASSESAEGPESAYEGLLS
jgi:poly-gamma-glutamate synthase PgsB/CapB